MIYLLKQLKHQSWLLLLFFEGLKDRYRLYRDFPKLKTKNASAASVITSSYQDYITNVSHQKMAASLELATFLADLCVTLKPQSVLDLGSGFSTFIFSNYKQSVKQSVKLWSVDDNLHWLTKTKNYLQRKKLYPTKLLSWNSLEKLRLKQLPFELILYDLGTMDTRKRLFPYLLSHTMKGSLIVVDDMHMLDYQRLVRKLIRSNVTQWYSLRSLTKDKYNRFAMLIVR